MPVHTSPTLSPADCERLVIASVGRLLRRRHGLDTERLRPSFVRRRLLARSRRTGAGDLEAYFRLLRRDPCELEACSRALANHFSRFHVPPLLFAFLDEVIFPAILDRGRPLKIVSAGCSSGHEPYTLGMAALEHLALGEIKREVRVLGFDLDRDAVRLARRGHFTEHEILGLPPRWRELYFDQEADRGVAVGKLLRGVVRIRRADILKAGRGSHELVFCRNVLIHLLPDARTRLIRALVELVAPGGYLVVARVEAPLLCHPRLSVVDRRNGIFRRPETPA